jgi:hypothetical protein
MANKRNYLEILTAMLVLGMAVVSCDNGTTNGNGDNASNPFVGTWIIVLPIFLFPVVLSMQI